MELTHKTIMCVTPNAAHSTPTALKTPQRVAIKCANGITKLAASTSHIFAQNELMILKWTVFQTLRGKLQLCDLRTDRGENTNERFEDLSDKDLLLKEKQVDVRQPASNRNSF